MLARKLVSSPVGGTDYRIWERDLADLSSEEIRHGLEKSKDFIGFFDLPKFRQLCKRTPEDMGLPDTRSAYNECFAGGFTLDRAWSHPAVYRAAAATGSFEMQSLPNDQLYPLFKHNYEVMVDRVMRGEILETPVQKVIPAKLDIPLTPEQEAERFQRGADALASLRAELGL